MEINQTISINKSNYKDTDMQLKDINQDILFLSESKKIDRYILEYTYITESELLEEGMISWLSEKKELGQFIIQLINKPSLLDNVSTQINKWTFAKYLKYMMATLNEFIKKIDAYIISIPSFKSTLEFIKDKTIWLKNFITTLHQSIASYSGFKKLMFAVVFSGLVAKIYSMAKGFFDFIKNFVIDVAKDTAISVLSNFKNLITFFVDIDTFKDIGAKVSSAAANLSGLSTVVSIVAGAQEAMSYIYALLKAAMDKFKSLVIGGSASKVAPQTIQ